MYKEQVKRQMAELDPIKRMEVDPNYINAVLMTLFIPKKIKYSRLLLLAKMNWPRLN